MHFINTFTFIQNKQNIYKLSNMFNYTIYGVILESDLDIPMLVGAETGEKADIFLRETVFSEDERRLYIEEETVLGEKLSFFSNDDLICVMKNGNTILYEPLADSDIDRVRAFILGYGMAMLFLQRKMLAVHCSGIRFDDKAIMISGGSGSGKSSLARQFLEHGYGLMADDMMVAGSIKVRDTGMENETGQRNENETRQQNESETGLQDENGIRQQNETETGTQDKTEIVLAYPAFPSTKLCADMVVRKGIYTEGLQLITENKDKYLVPYEGDFSCEPARLEALCVIVVLAPEADVEILEVTGTDKLRLLIDNLFIDRSIMFYSNNPLAVSLAAQLASHIRVIVVGRPDGRDTTLEQYEGLKKIL